MKMVWGQTDVFWGLMRKSLCVGKSTSTASSEFGVDVHEVRKIFCFFLFGGVAPFFRRVQHGKLQYYQ